MARKKWRDTSANRKKRWNKKSPIARTGKQNGAWKGGKSAHYYRRKANAGKNEVVHHVSGGKGGRGKPGVHSARTAKKGNLRKVTAAQHNKSANKNKYKILNPFDATRKAIIAVSYTHLTLPTILLV